MGKNKRFAEPRYDPYLADMLRRGMDPDTYLRFIVNKTILTRLLELNRGIYRGKIQE